MNPVKKMSRHRKIGAKSRRTKVFADGSALILDQLGHAIGIIEASPKYATRRKLKSAR
jgi:hypothetical protein